MTAFTLIGRGERAALAVVAGLASLSLLSGLVLLFDVDNDLPRVAQALFEPAPADAGCSLNESSTGGCRIVGIGPTQATQPLPARH